MAPNLPSPPQFRLGSLMIAVAAVGGALAMLPYLPAVGVLAALLIGLTIGAHVAGNALGTRLRDSHGPHEPSIAPPTAIPPQSVTRLRRRLPLGKWVLAATVAGAGLGAFGGYGLVRAGWNRLSPAGIALAFVASAILGAFWSFLVASFLRVLMGAIREALRDV